MIASLPMYRCAPGATQEFWDFLARRLKATGLREVPDRLLWPVDLTGHWLDPRLLLSQACGYPLLSVLQGKVTLVGAFHYEVDGCDGLMCRSLLVTRSQDHGVPLQDFRGRSVAFNSDDSQSGYNALRAMVAPLARQGRFFGEAVATGSHMASVQRVHEGTADIAAIDCVTYAELGQHRPELLHGLQVLGHSDPYPALPLITSLAGGASQLSALRQALQEAMDDPALARLRRSLFIGGFEALELPAYDICRQMREQAAALGVTRL
jgi:ABC-type phosphate/phosphonate transport system substrate-binding protein